MALINRKSDYINYIINKLVSNINIFDNILKVEYYKNYYGKYYYYIFNLNDKSTTSYGDCKLNDDFSEDFIRIDLTFNKNKTTSYIKFKDFEYIDVYNEAIFLLKTILLIDCEFDIFNNDEKNIKYDDYCNIKIGNFKYNGQLKNIKIELEKYIDELNFLLTLPKMEIKEVKLNTDKYYGIKN